MNTSTAEIVMRKIKKQNVNRQIVLGRTLLNEAKLGKNLEITIQEGAILILPEAKKKGWQLLAMLGEDSSEGMPDEPAQRHDECLRNRSLESLRAF